MAKKVKKTVVSKKALAEVSKLAIGARLLDVLNLLKGLDLAKIAEIASLATALATTTDLKTRIKLALQLAALAATLTPADADDKLVATVSSIVNNDAVLDILVVIVGRLLGPKASSVKANAFKKLDVSATGLNVTMLLKLAKMLATLLALFA